jgi:HlyD family secretion protein
MKRNSLIAVGAVLALVAGVLLYRHYTRKETPPYRFAVVARDSLESAVSATGILSAVTSVQVGTQVSGQVAAIFADFNAQVKKGQLIARIDPTLQQQAVRDAQAGLDRAGAELSKARQDYQRNQGLFASKVLTEVEFNDAKYSYEVAQANVKSAQVALDRARQNLAYTSIYAPIDGVVVERNVDVGQTVASSYSTPQLFLIAKDLSQMQILASVDESDIGLIREGQPVRFAVQAYPNQSFQGSVSQVRLQSKITENVVNYTVAVAVQNATGKLLPGMTATVDFLTGSAANVLTVPNAALRFRPPQEELAKLGRKAGAGRAFAASPAGASRTAGNGARLHRPENAGVLWHLDAQGKLAAARVRTGITDGQKTEVEGPGVTQGLQVIVGSTQTEQATGAGIFQPAAAPRQGGAQRRGF